MRVLTMRADQLFTLPASLSCFASHFTPDLPAWTWVKVLAKALEGIERRVPDVIPAGVSIEGAVHLEPSVKLPPFACIIGPAFIGAGTEIRPGAYIRGNVITGANCVLGNSCEFKNALLLDHVQVPHFSYVGDSALGTGSHLGAGVILSNLRLDQKPISVRIDGALVETGMRKLGALVGDNAEVGCNAVLQPGTILGRRSLVLPTLAFAGTLPEGTIARERPDFVYTSRRD
jgi:UDP-N-acetylglucosamine diphosphorylase / glucose-1-phosphate thymidylyltransferase / UDP-N-acetylgalactosamine diphosphorylase / glucosamine-1-phosphate N-acetyltransferase / galactosamine-1-phosphate N-acetyltransferase